MVRTGSRTAELNVADMWPEGNDDPDMDASVHGFGQNSALGHPVAHKMNDSFLLHAAAMPPNEEVEFKHAGILLYRYNIKNGCVEGMMGHSFKGGNITLLVKQQDLKHVCSDSTALFLVFACNVI
jgi:hypothetical protein